MGDFKYFKEGKTKNYVTSFEVLEGGNYTIVLAELFPCDTKMELHQRERYYIENNDCVNKNIPTRTQAEYYVDNRTQLLEYDIKYQEENKEKIRVHKAEYALKNKEKIKIKQTEWNLENKEKRKITQAKWNLQNKEKLKTYLANYYLTNKEVREAN